MNNYVYLIHYKYMLLKQKFKIYYCPMRKRAFRFSNGLIGRAANLWYREIQFMKKAILIASPLPVPKEQPFFERTFGRGVSIEFKF